MNNILIQTQLKSIEEELRAIKMKVLNTKNRNKIYLSSLKDMFPQEIEYKTIKETDIFKYSRCINSCYRIGFYRNI